MILTQGLKQIKIMERDHNDDNDKNILKNENMIFFVCGIILLV